MTHRFERCQSSDATRVRTNDLEVRELEREPYDGRVNLTLRYAYGLGQTKVRKYAEPSRLLRRSIGDSDRSRFGILSIDRLRTWSRRCVGGLHALLRSGYIRGRGSGALLHTGRSLAVSSIWGTRLLGCFGCALPLLELAALGLGHLLLRFRLADMRDVAVGRHLSLGIQGKSGGHGCTEGKKLRLRKKRRAGREDMFCGGWDWRSDSSHAPVAITTFLVTVRPAGVIGAGRCVSRAQTLLVARLARRRSSLYRPAATAFGLCIVTSATYIYF